MALGKASAARMWAAGMGIGARTFPQQPLLGLKRLILPVSYWRAAEFSYVMNQLRVGSTDRVLDLGSPKDLAVLLARFRGCAVVATDILPEAIELSERYAQAQGVAGKAAGQVWSEVQDGREMPYADCSFDAAFSVSVLEHIPGRGDSEAIVQIARIVKPGGRIALTVPYATSYRETFVDRSVYERSQSGHEPVFFERHYDDDALADRLIRPSSCKLVDLQLWGEGRIRVERAIRALGKASILVAPAEALLAAAFLRPRDQRGHPMAAFITLERS
jgi:SAM-dependent methyltransferase